MLYLVKPVQLTLLQRVRHEVTLTLTMGFDAAWHGWAFGSLCAAACAIVGWL